MTPTPEPKRPVKNKPRAGVSALLAAWMIFTLPWPGICLDELKPGETPRLKSARYSYDADSPENFQVVFTFIGKPSSYAQNLDKAAKKLEIVFYDVQRGPAPILSLKGGPILGGRVEELDENLTQVQGLTTKDVHHALKVTLELEKLFTYEISSEHNVITLTRKGEEGINWKIIGGGVLVMAAIVTAVLFMVQSSSSSWDRR